MYLQKEISRKHFKKYFFFVGVLKVNDKNNSIWIRIRINFVRGMDPRIWIHTKMSWIRNTGTKRLVTARQTVHIRIRINLNCLIRIPIRNADRQCCGSGSGIRCLSDPWIRDPE
jgi:hypothetical protein